MSAAHPAHDPRPSATATAPALEGDLAVFPPTDLFQFFALLGLSGTLELVRETAEGPERVCLRLHTGRLVAADTNGPRPFLGEILVRRYGVALEAVLDGLQQQTAARRRGLPSARLGQLLLERQHLSGDVLRQALDDAVSRIAGPVLLWGSGSFTFHSEPSRLVPGALGPERPLRAEELARLAEACAPEVSLEELVLRRWNPAERGA